MRGIDLTELPWGRFNSLVYYWATKDADPSDLDKFDSQLFMPPKGVVPTKGPWTPEAETEAFGDFARAVNG